MDSTIKTVKIRAYSDDAKSNASQGNISDDQNKSLEIAKKNTQLEEEKKKSLEQLKIIEQLRESLKQEQARMAEIVKKTAGQNANELAIKDAQLEEEKSRSLENLKMIVQLRENLKQEQGKTAEMAKKATELEAKTKESTASVANELAKKTAQLEEEKQKSFEQIKSIEQLMESLKQEQGKSAGAADKIAELEAKTKELAVLGAKLKDLNGVIDKIASIAEAGKLVSNA